MTSRKAKAAMGARDGDELVLGNLWATVTIRREWGPDGSLYMISGDCIAAKSEQCSTLAVAINLALLSLAEYERGRMDLP